LEFGRKIGGVLVIKQSMGIFAPSDGFHFYAEKEKRMNGV
jgi:hypothetical protein